MKRRRKKKRKQSRKRRTKRQSYQSKRSVRFEIEALEIATGHDGFLRGAPEPTLIYGVFAAVGQRVDLVGRGIANFRPPNRSPVTVKPQNSGHLRAPVPASAHRPLVVLVIAMEEDGGRDLQRAYAMLEASSDLLILETCEAPNALHIAEIFLQQDRWQRPRKVDLLLDGSLLAAQCDSDKWIAASVFTSTNTTDQRIHFRATNGKNDWTALVRLSQRGLPAQPLLPSARAMGRN